MNKNLETIKRKIQREHFIRCSKWTLAVYMQTGEMGLAYLRWKWLNK